MANIERAVEILKKAKEVLMKSKSSSYNKKILTEKALKGKPTQPSKANPKKTKAKRRAKGLYSSKKSSIVSKIGLQHKVASVSGVQRRSGKSVELYRKMIGANKLTPKKNKKVVSQASRRIKISSNKRAGIKPNVRVVVSVSAKKPSKRGSSSK